MLAVLSVPHPAEALAVRQRLLATGMDADARGKAALRVRKQRGDWQGQLAIVARNVDPASSYVVTIDGVRIGGFATSARGKGKARFRTQPRSAQDQILGVDPRGRALEVLRADGVAVLMGTLVDDSLADGVRCCVPGDAGPTCEDRSPAECAAGGGVDLGPGSCLPAPCEDGLPRAVIVCCLPRAGEPECQKQTVAGCSAAGGIGLGAGSCTPNPCGPGASTTTTLPGGTTTTTLPGGSTSTTLPGPTTSTTVPVTTTTAPRPTSSTSTTSPPTSTTSTTVPATGEARLRCERRDDRSHVWVEGRELPAGTYRARIRSGSNTATSGSRAARRGEVEFEFDSRDGDIPNDFLVGDPPEAAGEILDGDGAVVASDTARCRADDDDGDD